MSQREFEDVLFFDEFCIASIERVFGQRRTFRVEDNVLKSLSFDYDIRKPGCEGLKVSLPFQRLWALQ